MLDQRDAGFVGIVMLLFIVVVSIPYVIAASADTGYMFGGFLVNPIDGNSYLTKMYQGWQGAWRFQLAYTAEPGEGAYLFLFYLFLGHIARVTNLPLILVYHITRLLATLVMLYVLYRFLWSVLTSRKSRWLAFVLASFGSGLGWLVLPFGGFTSDFWVAEAYPFLSGYNNPHFPFSLTLLLILLFIHPIPEKQVERLGIQSIMSRWHIGVVTLILAVISPFGVVMAFAVLAGFIFYRKILDKKDIWMSDTWIRIVWIALGGFPLLVYYVWVIYNDPILMGWNMQNLTPAPAIWDTLLSISPAIVLALPGAWFAIVRGTPGQKMLLVWAILGLCLMYIPFGLQRRFIMGLYVPLAGLAALGVEYMTRRRNRLAVYIVPALFFLAIPTNLIVVLVGYHGIQTRDPMLYLTKDEVDAFDWMAANTPGGSVILAAPQTGLFIPAHSGRRVVYGHPFETVNAEEMENAVIEYFNGQLVGDRKSIQLNADYLFWGPREREIGILSPEEGMSLVYQNDEIRIFSLDR